MLIEPSTPIGLTVHLLSQIDEEVEKRPVDEQPGVSRIEDQAIKVADLFAEFVGRAETTLDICIYDFRLDLPAVSEKIVAAINGAAAKGVAVRVAYDANQKSDEEIIKQFSGAGGDPAPTGTQMFLEGALQPAVETKAIAEESAPAASGVAHEPIIPNSQIMHNKYMVADAGSDSAAVWMGSANFTVDAWALQDNNVIVLASQDLAAKYTQDFEELWKAENLHGTGKGDAGSVTLHGLEVGYAFAPAEGTAIRDLIAAAISAATRRIRVASMVTSSPEILTALKGQIDASIDFGGVYDYFQSTGVIASWDKHPEKVELLKAVLAHLVPKHSLRFEDDHPDWAHNFMHNKIVVADDTVVTGSFNFSANALRNAENAVSITEPKLAEAYAGYIDGLAARYG
jgi:phosphatidylserine/phosphatidylglycerophosphate/cardiolipin synthase-like enzyme